MSTATTNIETEKRSAERSRSKLVPVLRFKEFGDEWGSNKFSNYIKLYRGSSPRPIVKYVTSNEDGVNWIKIGDTKHSKNYRISKVSEKITKEGALKSRHVEEGEVILANSMSFGKSYLLEIEGCIYDGWFVLREYNESFEKEFLLQVLNSEYLQKQYMRLSAGGVVQNISSEIVYSTILFCPPIPEQQKIASFLSAVDEKIQQLTKKKALLKQYKKGVMQQLFSCQLRFKDENGNPYPDWEVKRLSDLLSEKIANGETVDKNYYTDEGNYFLIQLDDLFKSAIVLKIDKLCRVNLKQSAKKIKLNDIIINRVSIKPSGVAKVSIVSNLPNDLYTSFESNMFRVRLKSDTINTMFFSYFSLSSFYIKQKLALAKVTNQASLSQGDICFIKTPVPYLEEQQKIATYLSHIDIKIEAVTHQIRQTQTFKKGLLQQMFI